MANHYAIERKLQSAFATIKHTEEINQAELFDRVFEYLHRNMPSVDRRTKPGIAVSQALDTIAQAQHSVFKAFEAIKAAEAIANKE